MHIHGGGFMAGTLDRYRHVTEALSHTSGMAVLAIDYRLAPEHPFPAGLDDCVTAWIWMRRHDAAGEPEPRAAYLTGSSAGGHLALAIMLRLRDENKPLPKFGGFFARGFFSMTCDGAVHFIDNKVKKKDLRALITSNGNEKFHIKGIPYEYPSR